MQPFKIFQTRPKPKSPIRKWLSQSCKTLQGMRIHIKVTKTIFLIASQVYKSRQAHKRHQPSSFQSKSQWVFTAVVSNSHWIWKARRCYMEVLRHSRRTCSFQNKNQQTKYQTKKILEVIKERWNKSLTSNNSSQGQQPRRTLVLQLQQKRLNPR